MLDVAAGQGLALRRWVGDDGTWILCTDERDVSGIVPCSFLKIVEELPRELAVR